MKTKVSYITRTCTACPSQWRGCGENGEGIYIRYRWIEYALKDIERYKNEIAEMVAEISHLNLKEE